MSEHVNEEALRRVMSGETESSAKLAVLQHLARCQECAAIGRRIAEVEFQAITNHFADGDSEPLGHLDEDADLRPYAAGRLDAAESEIVESHLDDCAPCRARLEEIHAASRHRAWWYAIAASLAVVAGLSLAVTMIRRPEPKPPPTVRRLPPPTHPLPPPPTTTTMEAEPEWQRLVAHAIETRRLPFPAVLATLSIPEDTPRGRSIDAELVSPAGVVIEEARPRFSWPATDRATYVVFVFDGEREVAQSNPLRANEWTPAKDLPRGRTLAWQVEIRHGGETSIIPGPSSPPALFRIITESDEREIAGAKTLHGDDPLLLAVVYARSGLRDAALEHLRLAAKKRVAGAQQILRNLDDN